MKSFLLRIQIAYRVAMLRYETWLDARAQEKALKRFNIEYARREHHIIHKVKTEWIFSGTIRNEKGVVQDAGYLRSPHKMNRAQALKHFTQQFPRANIVHVDDRNKIITYSF